MGTDVKMEIGRWNTPSHYSVEGNRNEFYVWIRESRMEAGKQYASGRVTGTEANNHYDRLREHFDKGNKRDFVAYMNLLKVQYSHVEPLREKHR